MKIITIIKAIVLSLIMMFGISNISFSQGITLPFQSDFSGIGGSSETSGSTMPAITVETMPDGFLFSGSKRIYEGGKKLKFGVAAEEGILPTEVINTGGAAAIDISFDALAWPQSGTAKTAKVILTYGNQTAEIIVAGKTGWPVTASHLNEYSCQFDAISTPTSLFFKTSTENIGTTGTNECRLFFDNVRITANNTPRVKTPTFTPPGGNYFSPQNIALNCATEGATIRYTSDGTDPTESSTTYSTPILVDKQTTIKAKAWKEGMEPSGINKADYFFAQSVSTLADLRALAPEFKPNGVVEGTAVFVFTGEAIATCIYNHTTYTHSVKYIQDETAAIMVFDRNNAILKEVETGDKITNLSGTLTNFYGMLELIPTKECNIVDVSQTVPVTTISVSQLDDKNDNPIQAKLIKVNDVTFTQTGVFEQGKYYNLKQNDVIYEDVVYNQNYSAPYINKTIPTYLVSVTGVCNFIATTGMENRNRIIILDNGFVNISDINQSLIQLAPNPANSFVNIVTGSDMKLEIYSAIGNVVATERLSEGKNTISISNYPAGIYLMKLIDVTNGQSFVQKLVIQ
jgi:hypothetical protein